MAQLFRVTNFRDSQNTWTFSFLLPPATLRKEDAPEILSREFLYGGHKWRLILSKRDKCHLSPYLELCEAAAGIQCTIDFTFFLINWDSYTQNEKFSQKQCEFSQEQPRHGARIFVSLDDLASRVGFSDARQHFVFELTVKSPKTYFQALLGLSNPGHGELDCRRYDTERFRYGDLEWQVVFCPNMDAEERPRHLLQLQRLGQSNMLCKLRYAVVLGNKGTRQFKSKPKEELFDFSGSGEGLYLTDNYQQYVQKATNAMMLRIELYSIVHASHLKLTLDLESGRQAMAQCLDSDKQSWRLLAHTNAEHLALSLVYADLKNIPSGYMRYVCWSCRILPDPSVDVDCPPSPAANDQCLEGYYALQSGSDKGVLMKTKLSLNQIASPQSPWMDRYDGRITVEICWLSSYLLANPTYSSFDDITRRHIMQMRRELEALQSENYSLERELHNYQMSISNKCSSQLNSPPDAPGDPSVSAVEQLPKSRNKHTSTADGSIVPTEKAHAAPSTAVLDNFRSRNEPTRMSADSGLAQRGRNVGKEPPLESIPARQIRLQRYYDPQPTHQIDAQPYYACEIDYRRLSYDVNRMSASDQSNKLSQYRNGHSVAQLAITPPTRHRSSSAYQTPFGELNTSPYDREQRHREEIERQRRASYAYNPHANH